MTMTIVITLFLSLGTLTRPLPLPLFWASAANNSMTPAILGRFLSTISSEFDGVYATYEMIAKHVYCLQQLSKVVMF